MKMIEVEDEVHIEAKKLAKSKGMTLKGFMKYIVDKEKKNAK